MSFVFFCIINPLVNNQLFLYGACRCKQTTTLKSYSGQGFLQVTPHKSPFEKEYPNPCPPMKKGEQ